MTTFDVDPFTVKGKQIVKIRVAPLRYLEYVDAAMDAAEKQGERNVFNAALNTARIIKQARLIDDKGNEIELDFVLSHNLPIHVAKKIIANFTPAGMKQGEVIGDGDGVSKPVHIKLGTPIIVDKGDPIQELEFVAKTYGDVEQVIAESNPLTQSVALLKFVARPIGMQALPTWAADAIEIPDGSLIVEKVLPRFLG